MKFTNEEMQIINKNLIISKCPNCGNEDKKYIFPEAVNPAPEDAEQKDMYAAIMARCPQCGFVFLFNKEFIMNK